MTRHGQLQPENSTTRPAAITYLTGSYPMVSHTFILREVLELRKLGMRIHTASIRRPEQNDVLGVEEAEALAQTFYVAERIMNPFSALAASLSCFRRWPRGWLAAAKLAWRTRAPGAMAGVRQLAYFLEANVLADHLRKNGSTHIHNHFADSSCTVAMLASQISGVSYSFTIHGPTEFFEAPRWRLDEKVARAEFVACISHFARSQLMLFSDQSQWKKLTIVHCGVNPAGYGRRPRRPYGKRILFVGRLTAVKGTLLLLDAVAAARSAHLDLTLTIIGDGQDRSKLEAKARALGLSDLVSFLGYQNQSAVAEQLEDADLLVLPSFAEGVPIVLMEAMASRLPVIASRVGGVQELVEHGVSGFVIPPGDVDELAASIVRLLDDPRLCASMGAAGRAKVEAEFSIRGQADALATAFDSMRAAPAPDFSSRAR